MATRAEKLAELQAELVLVKAQQASASAGGQDVTMGPFSIRNVNYENLRKRRIELEKSIQRLLRGGRGIVIDMSYTDSSDTMYRSGSELLP
jgi:hypothetical protein